MAFAVCECGNYLAPDDYLCFACGYRERGVHTAEGMNAMGLPISKERRSQAFNVAMQMAGPDAMGDRIIKCVDRVADWLEKDEPHDAMVEAMKLFDLTGSYRLFAYLLAS